MFLSFSSEKDRLKIYKAKVDPVLFYGLWTIMTKHKTCVSRGTTIFWIYIESPLICHIGRN
jgi:hypothetical protein